MNLSRNSRGCTMGKQILDKKSTIWTVNISCFDITNKF